MSNSSFTLVQANEIVLNQIEMMNSEIMPVLSATIDPLHKFDGIIDRANTRKVTGNGWRSMFSYDTLKFLTYGYLQINIAADVSGNEILEVKVSYNLPKISEHQQPLLSNKIERSTRVSANFVSESALRKCVQRLIRSLLKRLRAWYENTDDFRTHVLKSPVNVIYNYHTLAGALMQLKLNAELHRRDCLAAKTPHNADKIVQLVEQLETEMMHHINITPDLQSCHYN